LFGAKNYKMNGFKKKFLTGLDCNLAEQQAITQILSDMDAEIAGVVAQRDKYRQLKAGMMQTLLTGKTRFHV
jgi:restriction endonuclease S subunit